MTRVILCLGNPGDDYAKTKHNIGFRVGNALINEWSLEKVGKKFKSILYKGVVDGEPVYVQFPQTYMNLSGEAIQPLLAYYKLTAAELIVVYDDFDIPFGELRVRKQGGAGTHNGMKSIVQHLKVNTFPRLRFGIGPLPEHRSVSDFVLSRFTEDEEDALPELIKKSEAILRLWLKGDMDATMRLAHA